MSSEPPIGYDEQRQAIESMLKSVLGHAQYEYLSGPITGGPRYARWETTVGVSLTGDKSTYDLLLRRQVIDPNIEELRDAARKLREEGKHIIEPASVEAPRRQWSQLQFYRLWEGVITEHAKNVIFLNGWHLSVGCTYEFLCAIRAAKRTRSQADEELDAAAAIALIQQSADELSGVSDNLDKHLARLLSMKEAIEFADTEGRTSGGGE